MDILKLNFEDIVNLSDEQVSEIIETIRTSTNRDDLLLHLIDVTPFNDIYIDNQKLVNLINISTSFKEDYERLIKIL